MFNVAHAVLQMLLCVKKTIAVMKLSKPYFTVTYL